MSKKLYRVTIEDEFLVAADDHDDAYEVARQELSNALRDSAPSFHVGFEALRNATDIPKDWRGCLPYGGDGRTRVEDYFAVPPTEHEG